MTRDLEREIEAEVRSFLRQSTPQLAAEIDALEPNDSLWGTVESLSLLALVEYLEARFEIEVPPIDFVPENFATIGRVARYVAARKSG